MSLFLTLYLIFMAPGFRTGRCAVATMNSENTQTKKASPMTHSLLPSAMALTIQISFTSLNCLDFPQTSSASPELRLHP